MADAVDKEGKGAGLDSAELQDWLESLDYVLQEGGSERVKDLMEALYRRAYESGVRLPFTANTPYLNTIPLEEQ
ncbi:MAG: hypothetical protein ACE5IM_05735, partial [Nitrospinota bacterium]